MLFHVSQVPAIIHSQLQLSCKDQRLKGPFLYLFYYILHNVTGKRKPELPGSSHNKSSFYSTRAVLCNVSSRPLIGSDTHWLDYCSPTVVAEHSPGCSLITCDLTADTQERRNDCAHQLTCDCIWQGSERGHLAGLSLCRITKKVEAKVRVLNMYFALERNVRSDASGQNVRIAYFKHTSYIDSLIAAWSKTKK